MARFIQQNETRSDLQRRIAAELKEKASQTMLDEGESLKLDKPDGVDDQEYMRGTKKTTGLAGVWAGVLFLAAIAFMVFVYKVNN